MNDFLTPLPADGMRDRDAIHRRHGYRESSHDLRAGLEVSAVNMTSLPVELVSELLRLRKTWARSAGASYLALGSLATRAGI